MSATTPPNTIAIQGRDYVLVSVGATAAHLVARAGPADPDRPIVGHADAVLNPAYDPKELSDPSWSPRTLCGQEDWFMCPTEAGRAYETMWNSREEAVGAPSCRRCLGILDKQFPTPLPDDRLGWNVIRCVEELEQWGSIHIRGVPADQAELLRKAVRSEARKRGWVFVSSLGDGQLIVSCENALSPQRRKFVMADSMQRMHTINSGVQLPQPSWRLDWS